MKFGRLIDLKRCMGCRSCVAVCATENYFTPGSPWNVMVEYEVGAYPKVKTIYNPMGCMHCEKPACKAVCDYIGVKAIRKTEFGPVIVDYDKCIGCGYCGNTCPYGVPQLNGKKLAPLSPGKGAVGSEAIPLAARHPTHQKKAQTVEKCTFCYHKLEQAAVDGKLDRVGKDQAYTPSCDLVCPVQARMFGDIDDPGSDIAKRIKETGAVQLKKEFGTAPQVFYVLEEGAKS
ncbi:MAG: 4Fe-4S dicluster domain-containing protein [Azonexus sp.]|jgi:Fe-S-cluster-containing dehydrogenase component|nr:4Fe-4S dicluster domain-containing protein [Azonexus sp.]